MGVLNPNSTGYVHPNEPNLTRIENSMDYDEQGRPVIRTLINTSTVTISGPVNILSTVTVNSTPDNPVHVHLTEVGIFGTLTNFVPIQGTVTATQGTSPWLITGTVSLSSASLSALENISVQNNVSATITGSVLVSNFTSTVQVSNFTSTVIVSSLPAITGTVTVSNFTSTVHVDNIPTAITVTNFTSTVQVSNNITATITSLPAITGTATVYQGTIPWIVQPTSTATDVIIADSTYELNLARGLVDGQYPFFRSALNPSCDQNVETSIWVEGGIYPHGTWTSAQKLYVISTSASDTGQSIYIEGLDSNYDYQTETVTTNGTTAVATTKNFIRIWTATVTSAGAGSANVGEITFRLVSGTGAVVAHIGATLGITKLSQFTVPRAYSAYVQYGDCTTYHAGAGNVGTLLKMMVRPLNGSFVTAFIAEVAGGNPYRNDFTVPMKLTEKSDVDVRVTVDTSNTKVSANWQIILIPN